MKKTYKIKNYKGNLVESLKKFSEKYKGMKIVEAAEDNDCLKIVAEDQTEKLEITFDTSLEKITAFIRGTNSLMLRYPGSPNPKFPFDVLDYKFGKDFGNEFENRHSFTFTIGENDGLRNTWSKQIEIVTNSGKSKVFEDHNNIAAEDQALRFIASLSENDYPVRIIHKKGNAESDSIDNENDARDFINKGEMSKVGHRKIKEDETDKMLKRLPKDLFNFVHGDMSNSHIYVDGEGDNYYDIDDEIETDNEFAITLEKPSKTNLVLDIKDI